MRMHAARHNNSGHDGIFIFLYSVLSPRRTVDRQARGYHERIVFRRYFVDILRPGPWPLALGMNHILDTIPLLGCFFSLFRLVRSCERNNANLAGGCPDGGCPDSDTPTTMPSYADGQAKPERWCSNFIPQFQSRSFVLVDAFNSVLPDSGRGRHLNESPSSATPCSAVSAGEKDDVPTPSIGLDIRLLIHPRSDNNIVLASTTLPILFDAKRSHQLPVLFIPAVWADSCPWTAAIDCIGDSCRELLLGMKLTFGSSPVKRASRTSHIIHRNGNPMGVLGYKRALRPLSSLLPFPCVDTSNESLPTPPALPSLRFSSPNTSPRYYHDLDLLAASQLSSLYLPSFAGMSSIRMYSLYGPPDANSYQPRLSSNDTPPPNMDYPILTLASASVLGKSHNNVQCLSYPS
ncbi:hypothetical protein ACRALDRAFT_1090752 [Sodiomyces alcalophilus JCM 7366]|uniref:uncharacterized protein n=1 Tax=Sodiomyces alcalophilus JCM 7366 TaxID=591952 RepID=UPI0039B6445C